MGLDIWSSDDTKNFHIGYIGFSRMRSYFILHYSVDLFKDYNTILRATISVSSNELDDIYDNLLEKIGDLSILIDHSDCDGELTSNECKKLKPCLIVDEDKIKSVLSENKEYNMEYVDRVIRLMYDFIDIVDFCAGDDDVTLIFG